MKADYWDIEELAETILACDEDQLEEELYNKYEISLENYIKIIEDILPYCPVLKSPLSGELHHCLGITSLDGLFSAIVKVKYESSNK